jgi:hypothetical protein
MEHKVKVTQVLRVTKTTILDVEADSLIDAIEAVSNGEVDLPSASDGVGNVWVIEQSSLENEVYDPA